VQSTKSQVTIDTIGTVLDLSVTVDITHSYVADLTAYLVSPSLKQVQLFSNIGGEFNDLKNLTFSDTAAKSITEITPADWNNGYSGTWRPIESLSTLVGEDAAGIWTLVISDTVPHDTDGKLNSWSLNLRTGEEFRVTDENGFYSFDNLPAGTYNVREVPGPAPWVQDDPAVTDIPSATWANGTWTVTVEDQDDFNLVPPDAHRNVVNVDFGNYGPLGALQGVVYKDLNVDSSKAIGEPGLPGWTVYIDSLTDGTLGQFDRDVVDTTLNSDTGAAINHGFPVESKIWVGDVASITDLDLSLNIVHDFDADLTATLISPSGTRVKLFTGLGGNGVNYQITSFDDDATGSITTGSAPFDGTFQPMEPLSKFNGENSSGFWTLEIIDNSAANDGFLNQWSMTFKGDELNTVTDTQGHYSFDHLAPGTYQLAARKNPGWTPTEGDRSVTVDSSAIIDENLGFKVPVLVGDYSGQGSVGLAGYVTWRKQSGSSGPGLPSDGNSDDNVDQTDYILWRENFGNYVDDFGNAPADSEPVFVPSKTYGVIEIPGEVDAFGFDAIAGHKYQLQVTNVTLNGATLRLIGADGTTLLGTSSESSPFIEWTAPADGTYFADVRGLTASSVGTYAIAISEDPTGTSAANATLVAVGDTTTGATVPAGETDWYRFTAIAGTQYHVEAQLETLANATVTLLDTNGVTQLASATGASPSFDSPTLGSAVYFITVTSATSGTYNLSLSALPGPSAGLADSPAPSSMFVSSSAAASSSMLDAVAFDSSSSPVLWAFSTSSNSSPSKVQQASGSPSQVNDEALLALLSLHGDAVSGSGSSDSGIAASGTNEYGEDSGDESFEGVDAMFELVGGTARV
jgi:subtilisin-like proprotein convertase family protein